MMLETTRKLSRLGIFGAAAFGLAVSLAAPRPALALEDDGKENVFSSVLGLVWPGKKEESNIPYRERAPIVVPKNREALPPPQPKAAERTQAWPKDQEVARREAERAAAGRPRVDEVWNPVSRTELDRVRSAPGASTNAAATGENCNDPLARVCDQAAMWSGLRNARSAAAEEKLELTPGVDMKRQALTDPPAGYRKPTTVQKYSFEVKREDDLTDARQQAINERKTREERERN